MKEKNMKMIKKNIYLTGIIFSLIVGCVGSYRHATPEDKAPYQEIKMIEGVSDELFLKTRRWMAETFNSSKVVIELEDKENGKIIGNTRISIKGGWGSTINFDMTIIVDIKDGRIRLTAKNFKESLAGVPDFETDNAIQWQKLKLKIGEMFENLITYIQADKERDEW